MASKSSPPLPPTKRVYWITSSHGNPTPRRFGQHDATFIPYGQTDTITIRRIQKAGARVEWALDTVQEHQNELQGADIVIVLIGGNNIPSNGPLPDKKAVVDHLINLFDRLNGIGVRAVRICEIMPRYPYECSAQDARSKEMVSLIEKINRSLGSKLASRDSHAKVNLFRTIWDRETELDNCTSCSSGVCGKSNHTRLLCRDHVHLTTAGYMWLRDRLCQIAYMASKDLHNGIVQTVPESPQHKTRRGKKRRLEDD